MPKQAGSPGLVSQAIVTPCACILSPIIPRLLLSQYIHSHNEKSKTRAGRMKEAPAATAAPAHNSPQKRRTELIESAWGSTEATIS